MNTTAWARKLMPGHPDPRLNLALTLERAGRTDEALEDYQNALVVYPGYIPAIQAMTRLQLRSGPFASEPVTPSTADTPSDTLTENLQEIALRGSTTQWRDWAQSQLSRLRK